MDNMEQKYIVLGVAVVVIIAAVGGGFALFSNSNDNNDVGVPDVSGKWNLAYIEIANLWDDSTQKALPDADSVTIVDHNINPYESMMNLEVTDTSDHAFKGKLTVKEENDIHGTLNGAVMKFRLEKNGFIYYFEGFPKLEGHLSGSMVKMKNTTGESADTVICGVAYMMFIKDGSKPVSPRSDYAIMDFAKTINDKKPIRSVLHNIRDFEDGKSGKGTDSDVGLEYVRSHYMITVFNMKNSDIQFGVQATVSMGCTPDGTVIGNLAGNAIGPSGTDNLVIFGNMVMAHGKLGFVHHFHPNDIGSTPQFAELEYNVPYNKGGNIVPVYIDSTAEYKGTTVIKCQGKEDVKEEITRTFTVFDNTFHSVIELDGKKTVWFGEICGHHLYAYIVSGDHDKLGFLTGHVDHDGRIHLFGIVHDYVGGELSFLDIDIGAVKA